MIFEVQEPFDLRTTLRTLAVGSNDETGSWWWSTGTQAGTATLSLRTVAGGVEATAWGPGAASILTAVPRLISLGDTYEVPRSDGRVRDLLAATKGMRLGSTARVYEALVRNVLGQVVTNGEGKKSLRSIVKKFGVPADGPRNELRVFPTPEALAGLSYDELHVHGVERRRAAILIEVSRRAARMEQILSMDSDAALERLMAVRGIGPWTAANVMGQAYGDRDAVPLGDYHLPNTIAWALAGESRGDDDRMLELLEPYRPYRRHVLMAIKLSGISAPKYGPKTAVREHL